ncbi:MAG: hypothetical protein ACO3MB_11855 [Saprospiraceae bacterium]|jgi:hypothetical protein
MKNNFFQKCDCCREKQHWIFETGPGRYKTRFDIILDQNNTVLDERIVISDTKFYGEKGTIRLCDLDGVKGLKQILTEIENHWVEYEARMAAESESEHDDYNEDYDSDDFGQFDADFDQFD